MLLIEMVSRVSIVVMLVCLGVLSKRMSDASRARPVHRTLYLAACVFAAGILLDVLILSGGIPFAAGTVEHVAAVSSCYIISLMAGVGAAWYYWSWVLVERD